MLWGVDIVRLRLGATSDPGAQEVEHLHNVKDQGDAGYDQHEDDEDGLLRGSRHVAFYGEGAGLLGAREHGDHDEAIQVELADDEACLHDDLDKELGQVAPQQVPLDLHLASRVGVLWLFDRVVPIGAGQLLPQLVLLVDNLYDMAQVDQGRRGHEEDLENPEADVRDGEGPVVADVLTTRLLSVAGEIALFIAPNAFSCCAQHHDPEQEEDTQPYFTDDRGVRLDFVQQR